MEGKPSVGDSYVEGHPGIRFQPDRFKLRIYCNRTLQVPYLTTSLRSEGWFATMVVRILRPGGLQAVHDGSSIELSTLY